MLHVVKFYEQLIECILRLQGEKKIGNLQHGFKPNRGITDLIFALKILLEKTGI